LLVTVPIPRLDLSCHDGARIAKAVPMRSLLLALAPFLLAAASPATDEAQRLLDAGEEARAFATVEAASRTGDAAAVDFLAWFYDEGRHVPQDRPRAARLYRQAAEAGDAHAQWRLGVMLDLGEGVAEDPVEALAWIRRAAGADFPDGHASLAVMYANGRGVAVDYAASLRHYLRAAELGAAAGFYGVGVLHALGQGVSADRIEAGAWFLAALVQRDERAPPALGQLDLDAGEMRRAIARGNEILARFGREERLSFEEPPADQI